MERQARGTTGYLAFCLLLAAALCLAQIQGSGVLLPGVLGLFLLTVMSAGFRDLGCSVLLFFLPWSTVLKLVPGSVSFYTLGLAGACCVWAVRSRLRLNGKCAAAAALLLGLTLGAKLLTGGGVSMDYLLFLLLLALFPLAAEEKPDFQAMVLFFSAGILSAAFSARYLAGFGGLEQYVDVDAWAGVVRYSGFYGDANFYAAHISAALGGVLLLMLRRSGRQCLGWGMIAGLLLWCGLWSASKTFVITAGFMLLLWSFAALRKRRFGLLLGVGAAALAVLASGAAEQTLSVIAYRFSFSASLSELTTGRTELWGNYLRELLASPRLLLLGNGYTDRKVLGRASHNSLIQMVFQFGLVGSAVLICWMGACLGRLLRGCRVRRMEAALLLGGAFLPWMALDMVFFDEWFLIPLYAVAGVAWLSGEDATERKERDMAHSNLKEVSLRELWELFRRKIPAIIAAAVICAVGAAALVRLAYQPEYASTATLYILRQSEDGSAGDTADDFALALKVADDCVYLMKSHSVLEQVRSRLRLDMSCQELSERITVFNPTDTRILEVTVTMPSPEKAKAVADQLCQVGPEMVARATGFEQMNLLEYGTLETEPSNKVGLSTYLLAGIAGGAVVYGVALLRFLMDDREEKRSGRRSL